MPIRGINTDGQNIIGKVETLTFFDIKRFMAQFSSDQLFGQGMTIDSKEPAIKNYLNEFLAHNKFDDLMLQVAEDTAYWGRTIITIDRAKDGTLNLSYATPELLQLIDKFEVNAFGARILKRKVVGAKVFFVNEVWTINDVRRSLTIKDVATGNLSTDLGRIELPAELDLPAYEKHGLGFVPFVEVLNKPKRNLAITAGDSSQVIADDWVVRNMPMTINHGIQQHFKEKYYGKTRVFGDMSESEKKKIANRGAFFGEDYFITTDRTPNQTKAVEVQPGTYDGLKWTEPTKKEINLYAMGCGYSPLFPETTEQTEAETLFSKDATQRTIKAKRRRYIELLKELFSKVLVYKGLITDLTEDDKFTIEIKENVVYNQLQLVTFLEQAVTAGFMTRAEAIKQQRDLNTIEEAEEILKTIEADQEAQNKILAESPMFNQPQPGDEKEETPGEGTGKMAPGKDADPKGDD